jgi:hypothetical protein
MEMIFPFFFGTVGDAGNCFLKIINWGFCLHPLISISNVKICNLEQETLKKARSQENLYEDRKSFLKVFSPKFAGFKIEFKINEWLYNSENLNLRRFFYKLLGKNIELTRSEESL